MRGKVALITGGASGIGLALGQAIAQQGGIVVLADRNGDKAEQEASALRRKGMQAEAVTLDVADAGNVTWAIEGAAARHGRMDYLFNNAGIASAAEIRDVTLDEWRRTIDVNLMGVIHGIHAAYPIMLRQGFGHIVNVASMAGLAPLPMVGAYATTKFAVVGLSQNLRAEAAGLGVKVSVVCPGNIATPIHQSGAPKNVPKEIVDEVLTNQQSPISADECARQILAGLARNQAIIIAPKKASIPWYFYRFAPNTWLKIVRGLGEKVRKHRVSSNPMPSP